MRGPNYSSQRVKKASDLTKELLESGDWKTVPFKPYNFCTVGEKVGGGYLHPLLKVRAEFRKILMEMGFQEMPTNKWCESSFWNFDTLFQPQSHPARDAHDTFFLANPAATISVPEEYYERVKTMHEQGGSGSIGYRYIFKREDAMKNLLRTHTTAISSQMLYRLANQPGGFQPVKYYSIDRVFRNETMDATHLCEFHQVEGLVADYNLSLGDLIGTIETFFTKIGITKLRFKPAYNPYTEPSMEIFGYHPDLKKWTEIGNSGMFCPEMLAPMKLVIGYDYECIVWTREEFNNSRIYNAVSINVRKQSTLMVSMLARKYLLIIALTSGYIANNFGSKAFLFRNFMSASRHPYRRKNRFQIMIVLGLFTISIPASLKLVILLSQHSFQFLVFICFIACLYAFLRSKYLYDILEPLFSAALKLHTSIIRIRATITCSFS